MMHASTISTPRSGRRRPESDGAASVPTGCSYFRLRRLMRSAGRLYDAHVIGSGLKTTQYSLLSALQALGPISPGALARWLSMEPSTLTRTLRPLLDAGWAVLEGGPDGRSRTVTITAAGLAKHREARAHWRHAQQAFNARIGLERVAELHRILDACQDLLGDGPESAETRDSPEPSR